ncbi:thiamine transporter 1-like [Toxorhynchites rutilus septentrionalis]|uniref:thiamine transporter 1-like n=1 Tax=Toxorhynchites rutilus septentrionalis TaxID=329112 RepID=UPI00247A5B78|nr:thiamine transporter 1-like [Toxorhynchites rutilus septentrionalis]
MQEWLKISLLLCTFGFFREMRPSEPFVTEFLSGEWRDILPEQLNRDVYPVGTYTYLGVLIIIFLVTDILRYKSIIIFSACVGVVIWSLLLWTTSLAALQVVQVLYGTYMAAEVAYYTYIYAKISRDKYQQVTGNTRAAILSGRFLASVLSQALVSTGAMDLRELNYITLGAQAFSLLWAFILPPVKSSVYFYSKESQHSQCTGGNQVKQDGSTLHSSGEHVEQNVRQEIGNHANAVNTISVPVAATDITKSDVNLTSAMEGQQTAAGNETEPRSRFSCNRAGRLLWTHFISAYSNLTVVQWSLWWSLAMAGFIQVQIYVQLLWQEIDVDQEYLYNGGAEALLTLFGAVSAIVAGYVANRIFEQWALWVLTVCSALQGGLILYSGFSTNIWAAYAVYILFGVLYMFMITMASATVAKYLEEDSFGLIFGINTFAALAFQSILTVVVISESGLMLSPRGQFKVYGGYFLALALVYLIPAVASSIIHCRRRNLNGSVEAAAKDAVHGKEGDWTTTRRNNSDALSTRF